MRNMKDNRADTDYVIDEYDVIDGCSLENTVAATGDCSSKADDSNNDAGNERSDSITSEEMKEDKKEDIKEDRKEIRKFKDKVMEIEQEWSGIDRHADSAVFWNLTAKLYNLLLGEGVIYFTPMYNRSGILNYNTGKEIYDYLVDLREEANKSYDPKKGNLLSFLTARFSFRLKDAIKKEPVVLIDDDEKDTFAIDVNVNAMDRKSGEEYRHRSIDGFTDEIVMDEQLYELASMILNYVGRNDRRKGEKLVYEKLFYSSGIISYIKLMDEDVCFRHERDIMEAMHFLFTNFCMAKGDEYQSRSALTVASIMRKELGLKGDIFPAEKVTDKNRDEVLKIPLENEVVRGYLEREKNVYVTPSAISQRLKEYRGEMRALLRGKDLIS